MAEAPADELIQRAEAGYRDPHWETAGSSLSGSHRAVAAEEAHAESLMTECLIPIIGEKNDLEFLHIKSIFIFVL